MFQLQLMLTHFSDWIIKHYLHYLGNNNYVANVLFIKTKYISHQISAFYVCVHLYQ